MIDNKLLNEKIVKFCPEWIKKPDLSKSSVDIIQETLSQVLPGLLKMRIEYIDDKKIIGTVPYMNETANLAGFMHGGTIFSTGDSLAGILLGATSDINTIAITTRSDIKYIKPFNNGILRCTVEESNRSGNSITLTATFVDAGNRLISTMKIDYLFITSEQIFISESRIKSRKHVEEL